jgi:hypothetical protein
MLSFENTRIVKTAIHTVGNKSLDEGIIFSNNLIDLYEGSELYRALFDFYLLPFKEVLASEFQHSVDMELNEVKSITDKVFLDDADFLAASRSFSKLLYESMTHPKIKGGEFFVAHLSGVKYNGETCEAIGLFKSEDKNTFLDVQHQDETCLVTCNSGIEITKLEKGALILTSETPGTYTVFSLDNLNKNNEAAYWNDEFLRISLIPSDYTQTTSMLSIAKKYITDRVKEEFTIDTPSQVEYLNRTMKYFKQNEEFDDREFTKNVFDDARVASSFSRFKEEYSSENDLELDDNFQISSQALKRQSRIFKSVIKLDKNFHIYIHGNGVRDMIEQGVDEQGRKYYKLFYNNEQ